MVDKKNIYIVTISQTLYLYFVINLILLHFSLPVYYMISLHLDYQIISL